MNTATRPRHSAWNGLTDITITTVPFNDAASDPSVRTGLTYHGVQRRPVPAHRAQAAEVAAGECMCDEGYLCDAHAALITQEAQHWWEVLAPELRARDLHDLIGDDR
jgi:hypothetical protein